MKECSRATRLKNDEKATSKTLIGIALGQIGMDYETFLRLTPDEFNATFKAWGEKREADGQGDWNRMRL